MMKCVTLALCAILAGFGAANTPAADPPATESELDHGLAQQLPLLGHRNWIVVADLAYPLQTRQGIETVYVGGDHVSAVQSVLRAVDAAPHVQGKVFVDAELRHVPEADAPGITAYRDRLAQLFADRPVSRVPHEQLIEQLDEAAKLFHILIIKTDMVIPYTSVFIELDCGYWSADKEARLRELLKQDE
jgi:D-ribose pyranose/furanose isomerase RbsD